MPAIAPALNAPTSSVKEGGIDGGSETVGGPSDPSNLALPAGAVTVTCPVAESDRLTISLPAVHHHGVVEHTHDVSHPRTPWPSPIEARALLKSDVVFISSTKRLKTWTVSTQWISVDGSCVKAVVSHSAHAGNKRRKDAQNWKPNRASRTTLSLVSVAGRFSGATAPSGQGRLSMGTTMPPSKTKFIEWCVKGVYDAPPAKVATPVTLRSTNWLDAESQISTRSPATTEKADIGQVFAVIAGPSVWLRTTPVRQMTSM
mmetsp:Transcript_56481/g.112130  ORF Transcript_56481/g.112130 Transcript_56481/m.112130 type:complete len:259 (-) Transcript_56481:1713-2489(-)